jgi:hypothetical protein
MMKYTLYPNNFRKTTAHEQDAEPTEPNGGFEFRVQRVSATGRSVMQNTRQKDETGNLRTGTER